MLSSRYSILIPNFWRLQVIFWAGMSLITFLTLTLWYGNVGWMHISHNILQGVIGFVLVLPLHLVFSRIWEWPQSWRIIISLIAVGSFSLIWTALRLWTFIWITGEENVWNDFGGWYFGGIFVFLCWTGLYHGLRYYQLLQRSARKREMAEAKISREQLKRALAESQANEAQLKMLRYQLNPHFLFNTLNAVNSLVGTQNSERAQRMIVQLSQFLRYSLDNNPDMKISVARELDALMLYLEIEKTRFADRLVLDFKIDDDTKKALMPSLLLQPLIENSMKYAIAKSENGGTIKLRCSKKGDRLALKLSDTGTGSKLQPNKVRASEGRGIGMKNTTDRLEAAYGDNFDYNLEISQSGGLRTTIEIPFETIDE